MHELQRDFVKGIRNGEVPIYRRLVYGNTYNVLSSILRLSKRFLGVEKWDSLITTFFEEESMRHYQLWRMPLQFRDYVLAADLPRPFQDLVLFESLDHELRWVADEPVPLYRQSGNVMSDPLVVNPEHRLASFRYPVFKRPPSELQDHPGDYHLLLFRHPETLKVQLFELSALWLEAFEHLREESLSGKEVLERLAQQYEVSHEKGEQFFQALMKAGALLGYKLEGRECGF
jgi:uncharacterized protein